MKFIYVKEFMLPIWEANVKAGRPRNYIDVKEYMTALLKRINEECVNGYRVGGIVYDHHYEDGGVIFLSEDTQGWKYEVTQFEAVMESIGQLDRKRLPISDAAITNLYTEFSKPLGELHCALFINNISKYPFYFLGKANILIGSEKNDNTGKIETENVGIPQGTGKKTSRAAK